MRQKMTIALLLYSHIPYFSVEYVGEGVDVLCVSPLMILFVTVFTSYFAAPTSRDHARFLANGAYYSPLLFEHYLNERKHRMIDRWRRPYKLANYTNY